MDLQRLFLFLIFSFSVLMLWDNWQHPQQTASEQVAASKSNVTPAEQPSNTSLTATSGAENQISAQKRTLTGEKVTVKTDFLVADINTIGADIYRLRLLKHRDAKDKSKPFTLFQHTESDTYVTQSGLLNNNLPSHNTHFVAQDGNDIELQDGKNEVKVHFLAVDDQGAKVIKTYTFHRGSYLVDISYDIENNGATPITPSAYFQLVRDTQKPEGDSKFVPTYTGPAVYTDQEKFEKVDFTSIEKNKANYPKSSKDGWIGMLQHYFVAAWIPQGNVQREFFTKQLDKDLFSAGLILPVPTIEPGKTGEISVSLYAGPAQSSLNKIAPGLGLTVDYGWLTIIATPLFWLMTLFQTWVGNWGLAIILLTILIKLIFFPLSAASYRSMAKMRVVAPKLEKIKAQYGDDRERLHKAMMELYKTEKINPLGGCLPMLIQIPVFISLYWAILSSVELRHAPFFGWIDDLSASDPYYVLPLIMAVSMFIQTKLNPTPPDPMQAKVMQIMPLIFGFVFFFFPAGLVLYSVVNNVLSIAQQWVITKKIGQTSNSVKKVG